MITLARRAEATELTPAAALSLLNEILAARPRFGTPAFIVSHAVLTIGLGLVIHPAAVELWAYAVLGALVGVMKAWAMPFATAGYLLAVVAAAVVSALAFLAQGATTRRRCA